MFLQNGKNFPKALFYYNRAIDLNAFNPEIYNAIALLYYDNEDYIESKAYYEKALSLDPENLTALVDMGNVCFKLFDYERALDLYKRVLHSI